MENFVDNGFVVGMLRIHGRSEGLINPGTGGKASLHDTTLSSLSLSISIDVFGLALFARFAGQVSIPTITKSSAFKVQADTVVT